MKLRYLFLLLTIILAACNPSATVTEITPEPVNTATLPGPIIKITSTPDVETAVVNFLQAWQTEDYASMYAGLTQLSRDALSQEEFEQKYRSAATKMTLQKLDYEVLSTLTKPETAQASYRVTFETALVGSLTREMVMNLSLDGEDWKIQWEDSLILPELTNGNLLAMDIKVPTRGNIYDRNGGTLVAQSDAVALGITPGGIEDGQEDTLLYELSNLTGLNPDYIQTLYEYAGDDWYIPIGEATKQSVDKRYDVLAGLGGLVMNDYTSRYYFVQGAEAVTGYVLSIGPEELEEYQRNGYAGNEKVGKAGLEKWGEDVLTGQRGASLYVTDSQGQVLTRLGQANSKPSETIYSTIDKDLQFQAAKAIEGFSGAVVVLERDTGRVLAMASSPGYDPNLFEPNNYNFSYMLNDMLNPQENRLINRTAQSAYPLGSVFKIITMAAALESGYYEADTSYYCDSSFTDLPGVTLYDWTYEKGKPASGELTLQGGLMRSCNPWFWHIGLDLYQRGLTDAISKMARGFGLGSPTGIAQIDEATGNIQDPQNEGDSVQLAIGQGTMLATPLQVANFIAAVGNGGTLYEPQLVEKIADPDGNASYEFEPIEKGKLPVSPENLTTIQEAMRMVVADPLGTARYAFLGLQIPIYGKTGTATVPQANSHAWFAGYTDAGREDKPDIAVVVLAENAGEGSEIAAPIFRRVVESYFFGKALGLYPWEAGFNVTKTPTEQYTRTPTEEPPTATPEPETATPQP